jgi:hypothetical protein
MALSHKMTTTAFLLDAIWELNQISNERYIEWREGVPTYDIEMSGDSLRCTFCGHLMEQNPRFKGVDDLGLQWCEECHGLTFRDHCCPTRDGFALYPCALYRRTGGKREFPFVPLCLLRTFLLETKEKLKNVFMYCENHHGMTL